MKTIISLIMTLSLGVSFSLAEENKLEALLDRAFDKEQARIMKGRDKDRDGKMSLAEFKSLYGEGGSQRWIPVFKKHCGDDEALNLKEFQAIRRQIHLGGGSGERKPSLENRFKFSKLGKVFRSYDKNANGEVALNEYLGMFEGGRTTSHERRFKDADANGNGALDRIEFIEHRLSPPRREGDRPRGEGERDKPRRDGDRDRSEGDKPRREG